MRKLKLFIVLSLFIACSPIKSNNIYGSWGNRNIKDSIVYEDSLVLTKELTYTREKKSDGRIDSTETGKFKRELKKIGKEKDGRVIITFLPEDGEITPYEMLFEVQNGDNMLVLLLITENLPYKKYVFFKKGEQK